MSRKKTSESVDEILKEVREQSAQAAAQSAASDTQVDMILASLGMGQRPVVPTRANLNTTASFTPVQLPAVNPSASRHDTTVQEPPRRQTTAAVPRLPRQPERQPGAVPGKPITPVNYGGAEHPVQKTVQPAQKAVQPVPKPVRTAPPVQAAPPVQPAAPAKPAKPVGKAPRRTLTGALLSTTANLPKTASEVQRYFRKTSPADELEDPGKLLQREQYFKDFFQDHQAVIPDKMKDGKGVAPKKSGGKKGFFGFGRKPVVDEETGEILIPAELNIPVEPEERPARPAFTAQPPKKAAPARNVYKAPARPEPAPQPAPRTDYKTVNIGTVQTTPVQAPPVQVAPPAQPPRTAVRPGVENQGTLAFPYRRTPRSNRTHIKTIEFEPTPRTQKRRASPSITTHVSLPGQGRAVPTPTPAPAPRTPVRQQPTAPVQRRQPEAPLRQETLIPPPQDDTGTLSDVTFAGTDTGAIRLDFANKIRDSINNEPAYNTAENARAAADILMGRISLEEDDVPAARPSRKPKLFGRPEEETQDTASEPFTETEPEQDYVDDYNRVEDAPLIRADLQDMVFRLRLRGVLGTLAAVLLLILDITARSGIAPVEAIDPTRAPLAFLGVNLLLLLFTAVLNRATLLDGVVSFRGNPSTDTVPFLATAASAAQLAVFLVQPSLYAPGKMTIFAGIAALLLAINAFGKALTGSVVAKNFDLVSSGVNHVAAYTLRDDALVRKLTKGLGERRPNLLVSRPTQLVKGFITNSFSPRQSDKVAQNCALLLLGTAVISVIVNTVMQHDAGMAVSVLPAVFCFGAPLCATFVSAIPEQKMHQNASRVGAVIPGWSSIRQLGRTNVVQVSAADLFPVGSVSLHGIKTFEKERIDTAILYAASILVQACDTLQDVFLGIIQNNRSLLMKVENLTTELGGGFVGWIENHRVIVGNRSLMEKYDIDVPSMEYEKRFTQGGRKPIYLAVDGKLFGMFLVSYSASPQIMEVVTTLHRRGISLLLTSEDFSVDGSMVETAYGLPQGTVKVLSAQENDELAPAVTWLPESEGSMIHLGSFASFAGGLQAASGAAASEKTAGMVMMISVILSCIVSLALSVSGNNAGLALPVLLLYQIVWSVVSLIFPLIQKY